jgi:hypothetical protein
MVFKVRVEHELVNGETVSETFEGVEQFANPPISSNIHLQFADERDSLQLNYGRIALAQDEDA